MIVDATPNPNAIPAILENPSNMGTETDLDASIRFAEAAADTLRFCEGLGWLSWDGCRWLGNARAEAVELAKRCARQWVQDMLQTGDEKKVSRARVLENAARIKAVVNLAETDERLRIGLGELDRDAFLLNVRNGTLDLRSGELRSHRKEDFITKLAPVDFSPGATHHALDRYLGHLRKHDADMDSFLARCFGAALTGDASCESLFLLQGDGGSGKTTLVEAIAHMLGDYAVKIRFESLCQSRHGRAPGNASPDLIALRGSRLAYASEGDQSARLDAGLVKEVTGAEVVTARALYRSPVSFPTTWKLWLVSNFEPKVDSDDTGIWRRVLKLVFHAIPPAERDPAVKRLLTEDEGARTALLAWCTGGCRDWLQRGGGRAGLAAPASVLSSTSAYRENQDLLGQWWKELLEGAELISGATTPIVSLRGDYEKWARENGAFPVGAKRFAEFLRSKGLSPTRNGAVRGWKGIRLTPGDVGCSTTGVNVVRFTAGKSSIYAKP